MTPLPHNITFHKRPLIGARFVDQFIILLNQLTGERWIFNQAGAEIWHLLDTYRSCADLLEGVAEANQCSQEELVTPITEFLEILNNCGLIELYRNGQKIHPTPYPEDMRGQYHSLYVQHDRIETILLEITHQCNLRCRHCYLDHYTGNLHIDDLRKLLIDLKEFGTTDLTISGGEIFLHDDIFAIFQMGIDLGFSVSFITNGTLLTQAKLDSLRDLPIKTAKLSLYAMEPELHDLITGFAGSFAKTTFAIESLVAMGKDVIISTVVQKDTADQIPRIKEYATQLGCNFECDYKIYPRRSGDTVPLQYFVGEDDLAALFKSKIVPPQIEIVCGAGYSRARVNPLGEVFICEFIHTSLGNLYQSSIKDLWQGPARQQIREHLRQYNPPECHTCHLKNICTRCPGLVWIGDQEPNQHHELMCLMARAYNKSQEGVKINAG